MSFQTKALLKSALKNLILDIIDDEDLTDLNDTDHFENDLDMDSLQGTSLLIHMERLFKIKLNHQELLKLFNLSLLADRLWADLQES